MTALEKLREQYAKKASAVAANFDPATEYEQVAKEAEWAIAHSRLPSHLIRSMKATAARCRESAKRRRTETNREEPKMFTPNEYEIEVLKMLNGDRPGEWGAWVSACLGYLAGAGLCTHGPRYQITDAGKAALSKQQTTS